jgi:hypothetical protein
MRLKLVISREQTQNMTRWTTLLKISIISLLINSFVVVYVILIYF